MIEKLENDPALKSKLIHVPAISSLEGGEKTNNEKLQEMGISYVQLVTESMLQSKINHDGTCPRYTRLQGASDRIR